MADAADGHSMPFTEGAGKREGRAIVAVGDQDVHRSEYAEQRGIEARDRPCPVIVHVYPGDKEPI